MTQSTDTIVTVASATTYGTSAWLIAGHAFQFLNTYASAFGVLLGMATFLINWFYQHRNYELVKAKILDSKQGAE
jgi:hypothetical protein